MPENPVAHRLLQLAGVPVAAPSANTSGLPSPTRAKYVQEDMNGKIAAIVDGGDCAYGVESTVITLATPTPTLLRPGAVTKEMLEAEIGPIAVAPAVLEKMADGETAASPGMKYKHYAPKAQVILVNGDSAAYAAFVNSQPGCYALCYEEDRVSVPKVPYGKATDDLSQARELFDALRRLDELGAKKVYARMPRKTGVGMAVYNRLIRAAAFRILDLTKPFLIGVTGPTGAGKGYVCRLLAQAGLLTFAVQARRLSEVWFGGAAHDDVTRELAHYLLTGGVYGSQENLMHMRQLQLGGRARYLLSRIWMPYGALLRKYPALEGRPALMPLYQLRRWGQLLLSSSATKRSLHELQLAASTTEESRARTRDLLETLGLEP